MHPDLLQLQCALAHNLRGLNSRQTQLQPPARPNDWSIQQVVEHLLLTYTGTEIAITARLIKRTPTKAKSTLKDHLSQIIALRLGYIPSGRKAPPLVTPQPTEHALSGEELIQASDEHLTHLGLLLAEAEQLFGPTSPAIRHMFLGPLSVDQWCRFQLVHGRHHIKQILAIRKSHNIPPRLP